MNRALIILFLEDHFVASILPNESAWEALRVGGETRNPLTFYVANNEVRNDAYASERWEANDPNAFGDFYRTILDQGRTFRRFEIDHPPVQLLREVFERVRVAYVERMRAFDPSFDGRDEVPVFTCFVPSVAQPARTAIHSFLNDEGFRIAHQANYCAAVLAILHRKGIIANKVNLSIVLPAFGDLGFHYLEFDGEIKRHEEEVLVGRGVDHRIGNLAKLLVERAAKKSSSRLAYDTNALEVEVKRFHRRAAHEMNNFVHDELSTKVELSDFSSARVVILRRELERLSAGALEFIHFRFASFIKKYANLAITERILLIGDLLATEEFASSFEKSFGANKVIRPLKDFEELLARGMVATASAASGEAGELSESSNAVQIQITVTTTPATPPDRDKTGGAPPLPPLPAKRNTVDVIVKSVPEASPPPSPPLPRKSAAPPPPPLPPTRDGSRGSGVNNRRVAESLPSWAPEPSDTSNSSSSTPHQPPAPPPPPIPRKSGSIPPPPPPPPLPPRKK